MFLLRSHFFACWRQFLDILTKGGVTDDCMTYVHSRNFQNYHENWGNHGNNVWSALRKSQMKRQALTKRTPSLIFSWNLVCYTYTYTSSYTWEQSHILQFLKTSRGWNSYKTSRLYNFTELDPITVLGVFFVLFFLSEIVGVAIMN